MFIRVADRRARYTAFVLLMLSINVIDGLVTRSITDSDRRMIVASAASFDVVVVVSALYYWMLIRPGIRAPGSLAFIALTGVSRATYFYPSGMGVRAIVGGLCEAGLIGFVVFHVRRNTRRAHDTQASTDPIDAIRTALASILALPALVRLITAEIGILYYGLFSWRAKPDVAPGARAFSIHQRVGQADIFGLLPIVCVLEIVPVHLLLNHWSPALAWVATGLSLYGVIWLIGLTRAFRLRPVLIGDDYLYLRYGLMFQLRVPKEMIALVHRARAGDTAVPRKSQPTLCIEFTQILDAKGLFGIRKRVNRVAFTPDDEPSFELALAELTKPSRDPDRVGL